LRAYNEQPGDSASFANVLNLGAKRARYSRTGESHASSFEDSWLVELELKTPSGDLEANAAYWRRKTNIVPDPTLSELEISTWFIGLRCVLANSALIDHQNSGSLDETMFAMFFRHDHFSEIYQTAVAEDRGSIFMASLTAPLYRAGSYLFIAQVLYRKYVPDGHIVPRTFPPNNAVRILLSLQAAF
jgi:hypothetical protein